MISLLPIAFSLGIQAAEAAPNTYNLKNGDLYVKVYKDTNTLAASQAHNHLILASNWGGSFTFDPDNPAACNLSIYVPVKEMIVDADADRKRLGGRADLQTVSLINSEKKSEKICFKKVNSMETCTSTSLSIKVVRVVFLRVVDCMILLETSICVERASSTKYQRSRLPLMVIRSN